MISVIFTAACFVHDFLLTVPSGLGAVLLPLALSPGGGTLKELHHCAKRVLVPIVSADLDALVHSRSDHPREDLILLVSISVIKGDKKGLRSRWR